MAWTQEKQRAYAKLWRERNREKTRAYLKRWNELNRDRVKERVSKNAGKINAQKRLRQATPEAKAKRRAYDDAHRETIRSQRKAWAVKNPVAAKTIEARRRKKRAPEKRKRDREYRRENPERSNAVVRRAKAKKPELYQLLAVQSAQARRARKRTLPIEPVSLAGIAKRDLGHCHLCLKPVDRRDRSFDHLIPVARAGAYAEWNLMLAHISCNRRRGTKAMFTTETKAAALAYMSHRHAQLETP